MPAASASLSSCELAASASSSGAAGSLLGGAGACEPLLRCDRRLLGVLFADERVPRRFAGDDMVVVDEMKGNGKSISFGWKKAARGQTCRVAVALKLLHPAN